MEFDFQSIGIVGLGLIGGSMAKTIKNRTGLRVLGQNRTEAVLLKAMEEGYVDASFEGYEEQPDLILICLYPDAAINYVKKNISRMKENTVVVDCCGTKTKVCRELSQFCQDHGVCFVGGHPMAGIEKSGYDVAFDGLFDNAAMILCKDEYTDPKAFESLKEFFLRIGFGRIKETDYEEHDQVIAYTSQLAHVVSNAYIKSPTCGKRYGFSAGSFKDLTRVAYLNETMWTELFLENREALLQEIHILMQSLEQYEKALSTGDREGLKELLKEGRICKETDNENEANGK